MKRKRFREFFVSCLILFENNEILMKIGLKAASKMKSHFSLIGVNFGELFSYMQWL